MVYFEDAINVNFEDLKKVINEDNERVYSEELLSKLESGDFIYLNTIDLTCRNNRAFMEPLLYAVRNSEFGTYEIFKYYGENLQKQDLTIATEIAINEPEVVEGTSISNNEVMMAELVKANPEVIVYMSENLKNDGEFIAELCENGNSEVVSYVVKECDVAQILQDNPDLGSNKEFMTEAIKEDANILEYADENLKNDYNFIRNVSKENYEVVENIVNNTSSYGLDAIKAVKDTSKEISVNNNMKTIEEMSEKSEDKRYKKVQEKVSEQGVEDASIMRITTAMIAQGDKVEPDVVKKAIDYSILTMTKIQRDLDENGKEKVSIENMKELIPPHILNKLKTKALEQGLEIDAETESKLEQYEEFYNKYNEKLKEEKAKKMQEKDPDTKETIDGEQIEKVCDNASLNSIKAETSAIRTDIEQTREEVSKIGENNVDKSNDERS